MVSCTGKRKSASCGSRVYGCRKCTNFGCDQLQAGECSNQGFRSGRCIRCETVRVAEDLGLLVMTPQLQEAVRRLRFTLPDE